MKKEFLLKDLVLKKIELEKARNQRSFLPAKENNDKVRKEENLITKGLGIFAILSTFLLFMNLQTTPDYLLALAPIAAWGLAFGEKPLRKEKLHI